MKVCSACAVEKPLTDFGKNSCKPDGLCAACKVCRNARRKRGYYKDPEKSIQKAIVWNKENRARCRETAKARYLKNHPQRRAEARARYQENKAQASASNAAYRKANPGICRAIKAKRRAAKLQRTPRWLTPEDFLRIREIYESARALEIETGIEYHVDHIYPLQGQKVSGLHVPGNLQILTAAENLAKHNRLLDERYLFELDDKHKGA